MDKILVLHKGSLREVGTHQELLAERGIYFKLFQLQYKNGDLEPPSTFKGLEAADEREAAEVPVPMTDV
jgi:hypothetical protein